MEHRQIVVAVHVVTDTLLGVAYLVIATLLVVLVRRIRELPFPRTFVAFATFIVTCALVHLAEVATWWSPTSLTVALLKIVCAIASVGTAIALVPLVPRAVSLARACAILRDELATRHRDLEALTREIVERRREAERASRAKSDMLELLSHELRTPATTMRLQLDRLKRGRSAPEVANEMVRAAARFVSVVETLVAHVGGLGVNTSTKPERVDVTAVCRALVDARRGDASRKGIALRFTSAADASVTGERPLIEVAIRHVLDNAIEHTPRGCVDVRVERRDGLVAVVIRDTGPGLPSSVREALFEPFVVGESLRHKHVAGLGLGLAVVRQAVQALNGEVTLDAAEGGGTRVTILLPRDGV